MHSASLVRMASVPPATRRAATHTLWRGFAFQPTPLPPEGALYVSQPFAPIPTERKPFTLAGIPPLLEVILEREPDESPHRIISYETESGEQFNCAFFDTQPAALAYRHWFETDAVSPDGRLHPVWLSRFAEPTRAPSADEWLWGGGQRVLSDSRIGEYQLGDGHRYSRMLFRDAAARNDAEQAAVDPQFEAFLRREMEEEGVTYYGRLVTEATGGVAGGWLTKSRYGSLDDAQRGAWLIKERDKPLQ